MTKTEGEDMRLVTFHIQKDRRVTLGTAVHKYEDCPSLKDRKFVKIEGEIVQKIPKCYWCYNRILPENN